jgi:hypothetical protein
MRTDREPVDLGPLWVAEVEFMDEWGDEVADYKMVAVPEPLKATIDSGKFYLGDKRISRAVTEWRPFVPGEDTNGWWIVKGERA